MGAIVTRWVCDACGGVYFNAPTGRCPGCNGEGRDRECELQDGGVVKPVIEKAKRVRAD